MTRMVASAVTTAQTMDAIHIHLSTTVRACMRMTESEAKTKAYRNMNHVIIHSQTSCNAFSQAPDSGQEIASEVKRKNLMNDTLMNNPQQRTKRQREPAELLYGFRFPQPSLEGMLAAKKIRCPNECSQCSIG